MNDTPRSSEDEEQDEVDLLALRPDINDQDVEVEVFDAVRVLSANPVTPVRLTGTDDFAFRCHKGVSCWNRCCHGADITMTPMDILRLSGRLGVRPAEFLAQYTVPAIFDKADLPVAKLKMAGDDGKGACPFVGDEGCGVYEDRPVTCRYYPLGMASVKMKDMDGLEDFFFLVKEPHCQGHADPQEMTVGAFRDQQGTIPYERVNRGWVDILMKMSSWKVLGGPGGKAPTQQTKRMFFMATTDVDAFRRFVFETKFLNTYEIDATSIEEIKTDDVALLQLGFDWLKTVLFNEPTILLKEQVLQSAIAKARTELGAS
ncbi:MAG: YkgJ family cysteine cluster protein [Alphaproteobacteria bacterium]|nr:YkgJ family cysteine cluster protein [Alphaproteobacteria bacterium]